MTRRRLVTLPALALLAACSGMPDAAGPGAPPPDFAGKYAAALQSEEESSASAAPYLDLVDLAVAAPSAPGALPAGLAAIDALVTVTIPGYDGVGAHAIAYRTRENFALVRSRLERAWAAAEKAAPAPGLPFLRGELASALHEMALYTGEVGAAHAWGARRGCARAATVVGPLDAAALRALDDPSPIDPKAPLAASYPGVAPFAATIAPAVVSADACQLDVNATSALQGLRAAVVDLSVPRAGRVHLALTTTAAAVVDVGGVRAIRRGFEEGGRQVTHLASVTVPAAGSVRVVIRVAQRGDGGLFELDAWGDDGQPLTATAPAPGVAADVLAQSATPVEIAPADGGATLAAAGLLALGRVRAAEHLLEPADGGAGSRTPAMDLLYARALEVADDLPDNKVAERARGAVDRALAAWPNAWEAKVGRARAVERRRSSGEGVTEGLRGLLASRGEAPLDPMLAAYAAVTAKRAQLLDVSERAYDDLAQRAPGAPLLAAIDARLHARTGPAAVEAACRGGLRRADLDCYEAESDVGAFDAALAEIQRLRTLRGAPSALRANELATRIAKGDREGALAVYDAMLPGERRMLEPLGFVSGRDPKDARARLARDRVTARDVPYSLGTLVRALGVEPDPAPRLEEEGRRLVLADQRSAFLPGAGTAVLRHVERYGIDASGLVHWIHYDLRRVSGTTDVAQGATAYGPTIEGRSSARLLRKRIHKRDGRLLEPDAAANAQQASDLSQLEQGDYVEQIAEGWALPGDTGQIILDTPDLLPERTSVREATIEIRRASKIPFSIWSHPLLGAPEEKVDGDYTVSVWRLRDRSARRIEDGVPKMERSVAVSIGTQTWANIGRAFQDTVRSLEDKDPFVVQWIAEAAGKDPKPSKALVDRIVAAVGNKVKVAGGGELSDVAAVYGGGSQRNTARTTLELGQGSRSWLVYRALRELGVQANIAVAETEPFSAVASFPPHVGRFRHPLVIAKVDGQDLWIDADVEGPPLPPGRISPELRGRTALLDTGAMVTIESAAADRGDEVDVRLALDEHGDAHGTFTALLHGRAAQGLADSFETVVGTDRVALLRKVVLGWLPWADVDEVAISSVEGSWEVALRATIAIHGFARPEGKDGKTWTVGGLEPVHAVYPNPAVGTLGASYASRGARQNALAIESALQYHVRRRIDLPPGVTVTRAPAELEVRDPNVSAHRRVAHKDRVLEDDFTLSLPTGTVAANRYTAFVEKVQAIDDGFMAPTRLKVK